MKEGSRDTLAITRRLLADARVTHQGEIVDELLRVWSPSSISLPPTLLDFLRLPEVAALAGAGVGDDGMGSEGAAGADESAAAESPSRLRHLLLLARAIERDDVIAMALNRARLFLDALPVWTTRCSLLSFAVECGSERVVERLLAEGDRPLPMDEMKELKHAAEKGHVAIVDRILARLRSDVRSEMDELGDEADEGYVKCIQEALAAASRAGHASIIQHLLEHPIINPSHPDALEISAEHGHDEIVSLLLRHPLAPKCGGRWAIEKAAANRHFGVVERLAADWRVYPTDALLPACRNGDVDIVALLLRNSLTNPSKCILREDSVDSDG
jgi:hypothetical protein